MAGPTPLHAAQVRRVRAQTTSGRARTRWRMDCIVGRAARSCALVGHPLTAGKAVVFSADENAVDHVVDARNGASDSCGQGPAAPVLDPPAELDGASAHGHGLDAQARQPWLGLERSLDRASGCSGSGAGRRLLTQAPSGTAKPGSVHASHPLAQGESGHQPSSHAKSSPQKDLGPAQLVSTHAYPLTEEIVLPLS